MDLTPAPTMRVIGPLVILLCALAAGCASEDPSPSSTRNEPTESPTPASPSSASPSLSSEPADADTGTDTGTDNGGGTGTKSGTRIISADSEFGPMLFDATGQPVYLFTAESGDRPACYDDCAEDWPPVVTDGEPRGEVDVSGRLLGTTERADGTTQVTYAGHPLYYYAHEGKYEVLCHDVVEYGGTWLVIRPDGTPAPA